MRKYGIFLLIIHALALTFLLNYGVHQIIRHNNDDTWGWLLPPLIPFLTLIFLPALIALLALIYIWRTIPSEKDGLYDFWTRFRASSDAKFKLGNLKTEKGTPETFRRIKELRKELGEE